MLKQTAINHALTIANSATARGLSLSSLPGTPLAALTTTTSCCETEDFRRAPAEAMMAASETSQLKMHDHAQEEYELAKNIRIFLETKVLRTIQEELTPLIREIRAEVSRQRVEIAEQNALGIDIVMHDANSVYSSAYIEQNVMNSSLKRQSNRGVQERIRSMLMSEMTDEQIIETMKTVSNEVNIKAAELLVSTEGKYTLMRPTERNGILDVFVSHNDLLSYLFLRGVQNDQHPYVKSGDMTSEQRVDIAGAVSAYQWALSEKMSMLDKMAKDTRVWLYAGEKEIHVIGSRYLRWLEEEGNTKEAVIGAVDRFGSNAPEALNDPSQIEELMKYYQHAVARSETKIRSTSDTTVETTTEQMIIRHFHEEAKISEVAEETLKDDIRATREYFRYCRKDPLEVDATFISRAVCRTVGRGLDAEMILSEMQYYLESEENQDATVHTALQYALARLLGRYMAKQTIIETAGNGDFSAVNRSVVES